MNLSIRMQNRRFTRLTNAFSKKFDNHVHMLSLHFCFYNFCRIHKSLRVTPAMAAGITDRLWTLEDIVAKIDAMAPPPAKRGPTRSDGLSSARAKPEKIDHAIGCIDAWHGRQDPYPQSGGFWTGLVKIETVSFWVDPIIRQRSAG